MKHNVIGGDPPTVANQKAVNITVTLLRGSEDHLERTHQKKKVMQRANSTMMESLS